MSASLNAAASPVAAAFESLGLSGAVLTGIAKAGYTEPTAVQAAAIPVLLSGRDAIVSSRTGSGKTAAFMLPALEQVALRRAQSVDSPLERVGAARRGPGVLVLAPTRELAEQSNRAAITYGQHIDRLSVLAVVGGVPYPDQLRRLARPLDVLVATPGRLIDHIERGRVDLSGVHTLVLDEADRMLDMGFVEDIERIIAATGPERQTLLFSATIDARIARLAGQWMRDPQRIDVTGTQAAPSIEERLYLADDSDHKDALLEHLLRGVDVRCAVVFAGTKRETEALADRLYRNGHAAAPLHGDMPQRFRARTLAQLRRGELRVLVATDVAARGIDVSEISHVVNWDLPMQAEDYVHRIGRTGRAGREGIAVTFATGREAGKVRGIERFVRRPLTVHVVPGLEPRTRFSSGSSGERGRGGQRPGGGAGRPASRPGAFGARPAAPGGFPARPSGPRPTISRGRDAMGGRDAASRSRFRDA